MAQETLERRSASASPSHVWKSAIYTDFMQEDKASYLGFQLCNFQIEFIQVFVHKGDQRLLKKKQQKQWCQTLRSVLRWKG